MQSKAVTNRKSIVLAGNPNVGKSVFFNYLSGVYVDVSNYPGTTVEITSAKINDEIEIKDTPGVYGVSSFNDEEKVARDIILNADLILNIVSATSLERDLFLTKQLIDMGIPMILAINQIDEAELLNIKIDEKLESILGIPVFKTVAIIGDGMEKVKAEAISGNGKIGIVDPVLHQELIETLPKVKTQGEALLLLEGDLIIAERHNINPENKRSEIYSRRRKEVNDIINEVVVLDLKKKNLLQKLSNLLIHQLWGGIIAVLIGYLFLYQFLGVFIGGTVVDITEKKIMKYYYEPFIKKEVGKYFPVEVSFQDSDQYKTYTFKNGFLAEKEKYALIEPKLSSYKYEKKYFFSRSDHIEAKTVNSELSTSVKSSIGTLLAGQYGILTLTITYLLGLLLPLVIGFYASLSLLEDSGYLPRLAVLMDGILSKLGMNGRAIIPLILGLGCVTMASVTTRLLSTKKEKIIAMAILGFAIPCSAQLGVIQSLLAKNGGISSWLIWISVIGLILGLTGLTMNYILPGKGNALFIDLPPLRLPRLKNIYSKSKAKISFFMLEAVPAFFVAAFIVGILQVTSLLEKIIQIFEPICEVLLKLPKEVAISFILGMVRRDFGAFGLNELYMTKSQITTSCIVLTLFVPCIATVSVMAKEQSPRVACGIWIGSVLIALSVGAIIARII